MDHGKSKYDGVQYLPGTQPEDNPIEENEPVFLLRARDALSVQALKLILPIYEAQECQQTIINITERISAFEDWQKQSWTKYPN